MLLVVYGLTVIAPGSAGTPRALEGVTEVDILLVIFVAPPASAVGIVCGVVGLALNPGHRRAATLALLANGAVFLILFAVVYATLAVSY